MRSASPPAWKARLVPVATFFFFWSVCPPSSHFFSHKLIFYLFIISLVVWFFRKPILFSQADFLFIHHFFAGFVFFGR
jgi:hypothetical protein